jgi:protein tyrosine/serine phosphatase
LNSAPETLDLSDPAARRRAERAFFWGDHAFVRAIYDNAHEIAPGVWRSAQPSPQRLAQWSARGIKTILNLRGPAPSAALALETDACKRLGLTLINLRVYSREAPSIEVMEGLRALFRSMKRPALMHCKSGADRVGVAAAMFLFLEQGAPLDEALGQLSKRFGHFREGKTGVIDRAFELYLAHAGKAGIALTDIDAFFRWAGSDAYDPVAIKRDFKATMLGGLLTEKLLRRE